MGSSLLAARRSPLAARAPARPNAARQLATRSPSLTLSGLRCADLQSDHATRCSAPPRPLPSPLRRGPIISRLPSTRRHQRHQPAPVLAASIDRRLRLHVVCSARMRCSGEPTATRTARIARVGTDPRGRIAAPPEGICPRHIEPRLIRAAARLCQRDCISAAGMAGHRTYQALVLDQGPARIRPFDQRLRCRISMGRRFHCAAARLREKRY